MTSKADVPIVEFKSEKDWQRWLAANHSASTGVWLRLFRKDSARPSVTHEQALMAALCFGWIDGQLKKHDEESWLRKFTPRRPNSVWSKRNCELVERLTDGGKMRKAGKEAVAAAKADGRWQRAYDSPKDMAVPADFLKQLSRNKKALAHFKTLNKANTYAIAWRLQTAKKEETRAKRLREIIEMLAKGRSFHE